MGGLGKGSKCTGQGSEETHAAEGELEEGNEMTEDLRFFEELDCFLFCTLCRNPT
jgi:hypothetical protein